MRELATSVAAQDEKGPKKWQRMPFILVLMIFAAGFLFGLLFSQLTLVHLGLNLTNAIATDFFSEESILAKNVFT